jgi:hypothetical protein
VSGQSYLVSWSRRARVPELLASAIASICIVSVVAHAQTSSLSGAAQAGPAAGWEPPVMDNTIIWHVLFDQL